MLEAIDTQQQLEAAKTFSLSLGGQTIQNAPSVGTFQFGDAASVERDFLSTTRTPDAPSLNRLFFELPGFRPIITDTPRNYVQEYFRGLSRLETIATFEGTPFSREAKNFLNFGQTYGGKGVLESIALGRNIDDYQKEQNRSRFQNELWLGVQSAFAAVSLFLAGGGASYLGATQSSEAAAAAGTSAGVQSTGAGATIDPAYFGFDTPLFGGSEFSFQPMTLSPSQAALVTGAPAASLFESTPTWADTKFLQSFSTADTGILTQTFVRVLGRTGEGILQILSGNVVDGFKRIFGPTPPSSGTNFIAGTSYNGSSGGGGGFTGTNTGQSTVSSVGMVALGVGALLVLFLFLRRKG